MKTNSLVALHKKEIADIHTDYDTQMERLRSENNRLRDTVSETKTTLLRSESDFLSQKQVCLFGILNMFCLGIDIYIHTYILTFQLSKKYIYADYFRYLLFLKFKIFNNLLLISLSLSVSLGFKRN